MEKGMTYFAMGVAGALFLVFLLDLVVGMPFSGNTPAGKSSPFILVDIAGLLGSGIIAYLGFSAFRDLR